MFDNLSEPYFVNNIFVALHFDMDGVGVSEQVVQVPEYFLVSSNQKDSQIVVLFLF